MSWILLFDGPQGQQRSSPGVLRGDLHQDVQAPDDVPASLFLQMHPTIVCTTQQSYFGSATALGHGM